MLVGAVDLVYRQRACLIPFALGIIAAIEHRATGTHPAVKERLSYYVREFIAPLERNDPQCYTTALATAIIPLQALLFAKGKLPEQKIFTNWRSYVDHWESEMNRVN